MKKLALAMIISAFALNTPALCFAQDSSGPGADPNAAPNRALKSPDKMTGVPLGKGHNSFTRAQARGRIEKAGYANVTGLTLDSDGLWQATATRAGQTVHVALDYKGNVAAQ